MIKNSSVRKKMISCLLQEGTSRSFLNSTLALMNKKVHRRRLARDGAFYIDV